jgi:predicted CXXCH cytochrome family protein
MYYLLRKAVSGRSNEFLDTEIEASELILGAGQIGEVTSMMHPLQFQAVGGGQANFSCRRGITVSVDGKDSRKGFVQPGDVIVADGADITVMLPPAGFDFAVSVVVKETSGQLFQSLPTLLSKTSLSVRGWAIAFALIVIAAGLLIPSLSLFDGPIAKQLEHLPLPSDKLWSTGPLISAHNSPDIGDNCQACHTEAFKMVEDKQCLNCHQQLENHIDIAGMPVSQQDRFNHATCASCHREHNEPAHLIRRDKGLCIDCHGSISDFDSSSKVPVQNITGFNLTDHPEFRLALLKAKKDGEKFAWEIERPREDHEQLKESSNLKFPHDIHLNPKKVEANAQGEALQCNSCHTLENDGEHFVPITMDNNCRSCHQLNFDSFAPDLELPHGDAPAAIAMMEAHFIRQFSDPELREKRTLTQSRRIPGKRADAATCEEPVLECARAEALKEVEFQFADTGCVTCHEVTATNASDITQRWVVSPVKIVDDWYQTAKFNHKSHLSIAVEEGNVCETCHQVAESNLATDINIPARDNCLQCHSDTSSHSVELACVSCHAYHVPDAGLMNEHRGVDIMKINSREMPIKLGDYIGSQ